MECNFLPICYWHELFELVLLFKALNDLVDTSPEVLPKPKLPSRLTRSEILLLVMTFERHFCCTKTYQSSYMNRVTIKFGTFYLMILVKRTIPCHVSRLCCNVLLDRVIFLCNLSGEVNKLN
jgi:hypothetical protein